MITLRELSGLGGPSAEELRAHAGLRPSVSSSEVSQAKNNLAAATQRLSRASERQRRCLEYSRTRRDPADFGYSKSCAAEAAEVSLAAAQQSQAKARFKILSGEMLEQRKRSYEVDSAAAERDAEIHYVRGRSGAFVPVRDPAVFAKETPQARPVARIERAEGPRVNWLILGGAVLLVGFLAISR